VLDVPSSDLRKLVWASELADTVYEVAEGKLDEAQRVVLDALSGADKTYKLLAAKIWLTQTTAGRRRGWGKGAAIGRGGVAKANCGHRPQAQVFEPSTLGRSSPVERVEESSTSKTRHRRTERPDSSL
jgi:hypothetical protein